LRESLRREREERREEVEDSALSFPETAEALLSSLRPPAGCVPGTSVIVRATCNIEVPTTHIRYVPPPVEKPRPSRLT